MYDGVHRKKEIYDKRPEDHPQYPEEWRIFWEKRYKEIQSQGKDADNYDYKPDWIPYWAKKSHELYKNEIHVKTQDLLKKFDLKNTDEIATSEENGKSTNLQISVKNEKLKNKVLGENSSSLGRI